MCIFTGTIEPIVSATKILVAMLAMNLQLTVYQNKVIADGNVAMILPVPGPRVYMVDLSSYANLFNDLEQDLPYNPYAGMLSLRRDAPRVMLDIQRVGSYDVSVAANLIDLEALDWSHFALTPAVLTILRKHYASNFSFCVARLRQSASPHPIAYIHERIDSQMFIPTRHEGHANHAVKWDHSIFMYAQPEDRLGFNSRRAITLRHTSLYALQQAIHAAVPGANLLSPHAATLFRQEIHGIRPNSDMAMPISSVAPRLFQHEIPEPLSVQCIGCMMLGLVSFVFFLVFIFRIFFFK